MNIRHLLLSAASVASALSLPAYTLQVTIENVSPADGVSFGPVWFGFHDGSFDAFKNGEGASPAIEMVAELGDPSALDTEFNNAKPSGASRTAAATMGFQGLIYTPGTSQKFLMNLDPMDHRYLSFATMVVPSNDWFASNDDPMLAPLFDETGAFLGEQTWTVTGLQVWDAATEVNDSSMTGGAAFVAGADAMEGTTEGGTIGLVSADDRNYYVGVGQPTESMLGSGLGESGILRISVGPAEWGGYTIGEDGWVQTTWLGWIYAAHAPWMWQHDLQQWLYALEPESSAPGLWAYVLRSEGNGQ